MYTMSVRHLASFVSAAWLLLLGFCCGAAQAPGAVFGCSLPIHVYVGPCSCTDACSIIPAASCEYWVLLLLVWGGELGPWGREG